MDDEGRVLQATSGMVREGLFEEIVLERRLEKSEGESHAQL